MNKYLRRIKEGLKDNSGKSSLLNLIVTVAVAFIIMAYLMPIALTQFLSANTTGWETSWTNIWNVLPTFGFIAFLLAIIYMAMKKSGRL